MTTSRATLELRVSDPYAELPIKNHKYVKNCTELHMANKRIAKIANFDAFVNLEVLWINGNQLQVLDGLDGCFRLKQLYAQDNCICSLDRSALPRLKFLQELRLYNNKLKDLRGTLKVLSRLFRLRDLDLFGNAVAEEENYRLQVIRAIPSLDVLDRHVVTVEERTKAARFHGPVHNGNKCGKALTVKSSQALSGTVELLLEEIEVIKRKQDQETSKRGQNKLKHDQQTALFMTSPCNRVCNYNNADKISGLDENEITALKMHFQSFEQVKKGGIEPQNLGQVLQYLRTRGYAISINGRQLEGQAADTDCLESVLPTTGNIEWEFFVQLFVLKQLRCKMLSFHELRQKAADCFDKCAVMQRQLQAFGTNDTKHTQLVRESLTLSQQGYHLLALADGDHLSSESDPSQVLSSADDKISCESNSNSTSTTPTRFSMTAFSREKYAHLAMPACVDRKFNYNKSTNGSDHINDALARKYQIEHKDFAEYLARQPPQTI